jgi:hypothetical protein
MANINQNSQSGQHGELGQLSKPSRPNNTINNVLYDTFFKGSRDALETYRLSQSSKLTTRLNIIMQLSESKTNNDTVTESPITSDTNTQIIQRIINLKTFSIVPIFDKTNQCITHIYTVGMWYYWGMPDILIKFDSHLYKNIGFVQTLINIIHDLIFSQLKSEIVLNDSINLIDFKNKHRKININLNNFNSSEILTFNLVNESEYMDVNIAVLMWFNMYFVDAQKDTKGEPILFPLYRLDLTIDKYEKISNDVTNAITDKLIEQSDQNIFSDELSSDEDDNINNDNVNNGDIEDCDK